MVGIILIMMLSLSCSAEITKPQKEEHCIDVLATDLLLTESTETHQEELLELEEVK